MRIIPKKHNVGIELLNGISLIDLAVGFVGFMIVVLILLSGLSFSIYLAVVLIVFFWLLLMDIDNEKGYIILFFAIKYFTKKKICIRSAEIDKKANDNKTNDNKKKFDAIENFFKFKSIKDSYINYDNNKMAFVIKIEPVFFEHLLESNQDVYIDKVYAKALRLINLQEQIQFVKVDMPKGYEEYMDAEKQKANDLRKSFSKGALNKDETIIRNYVINERIKEYNKNSYNDKIYVKQYFLVCFGENKKRMEELKSSMLKVMNDGGIKCNDLDNKGIALFLKANFTKYYEPNEIKDMDDSELIDWVLPKYIRFFVNETKVDNLYLYNYRLSSYPTQVENAWARDLCNISDTRVAFVINPVEHSKAIKSIDGSIDELRERSLHTSKASKAIDIDKHLDGLTKVLKLLQSSNENFYNVNTFITIYDYHRQSIRNMPIEIKMGANLSSTTKKDVIFKIKEAGFNVADSFLKQHDLLSSTMLNDKDFFAAKGIGLYSSVLAASFPFVSDVVSDIGGVRLGKIDDEPAIFDFFKRDDTHVNSNMMVVGKSGSGKSYFTKLLLSNLAADNSKIFILDPENEYSSIVDNYYGKKINLSNSIDGLINPFHVIQSISEDESDFIEHDLDEEINLHLQFLESFFNLLLPGLPNETFEILNNLIKKLYDVDKFKNCKSLSELSPTDYPIFDDLYQLIIDEEKQENDVQYKSNLKILINYLQKFASGGRNSTLWNGYSKIDSKENLIVFNFQQLLANSNELISNAQMLLVIHWLNNEIIKNRNFNIKFNTNRKIVIIIDEAHVFIDDKHPVALDFMYNLAKRIRKYNGMQIVITQNIKDFIGTEEINRKSTAIINASQYSFIFSLSPDDMNDLCKLYEKSGSITESEQKSIVNSSRGEALFISSPSERGIVKIEAPKEIEDVF